MLGSEHAVSYSSTANQQLYDNQQRPLIYVETPIDYVWGGYDSDTFMTISDLVGSP